MTTAIAGFPVDTATLIVVLVALCAALLTAAVYMAVAGRDAGARHMDSRIERIRGQSRRGAATASANVRRRVETGGMAGLGRALARVLPNPDLLRVRLERTGRNIGIAHYILAGLFSGMLVAAGLVLTFRLWPPTALLFGIAAGLVLPHVTVNLLIQSRIKKFIARFPEAIELMVRGLKSGLPVGETVPIVGREILDPVGIEFRRVADAVRLGQTLEDALWEAVRRIDIPEFKFFVISLSVQRETGGNLAETLENLSDILRKRRQIKLKIKALSGEAKASALILGSLPFLMFGILLMLNGPYVLMLFNDPRGLTLVGIGLTSIAVGSLVMAKMVRFEI